MTKLISNNILKSIIVFLFTVVFMGILACSNNSLVSTTSSKENPDTPIVHFDDLSDGIGAVQLTYDGSAYGAVKYTIYAYSADKTVSSVTQTVQGTSTVMELEVATYKFTITGYGESDEVVCVGTITATIKEDVDIRISASLIASNVELDPTVPVEESGFLFSKVTTLCVGDTNYVQVDRGDNWFGFINTKIEKLYLSWSSDTEVQRVIVYKDGRDETTDAIYKGETGNAALNNRSCEITTSEGEHCYYVRIVATQSSDSFAVSLSKTNTPITTTTTLYIPVTTTSTTTSTTSTTSTTNPKPDPSTTTSTTSSTTTSTTTTTTLVPPTEKAAKPSIAYNSKGYVTISCSTVGAIIYYTTDGSAPTESSEVYNSSFEASMGTTINAIAVASGYLKSEIASRTIDSSVVINIEYEEEEVVFDGIRILVAQSLNHNMIHYWNCDNTTAYPSTSWPGTQLSKFDSADYYYDFAGCTSVKLLITNSNGGKLCGDDMSVTEKGTYRVTRSGITKVENVTPTTSTSTSTTNGTTTTTTLGSGIKVHCPTSLNYTHVYAWTGTSNALAGAWPGTKMTNSDNDGYYDYTFNSTSLKIIFNNGSGGSAGNGQTADLSVSGAGEYWYVGGATGAGSSSDWSKTNPDGPVEPTKPTVSISPANGSKIAVNGSISVSFTNGNDTITSAKVTINGTQFNMGTSGSFQKSVSDLGITAAGQTITVSASVTNGVGTTTASATLTTKDRATLVSDPNELRIYQVMVSSFQDGDPSRGYTNAYGPSNATKGGDLQGIINALDYIKNLGCNALWMTPIFQSNGGSGSQMGSTGYFAYDYFNIDNNFGTNEKFDELVAACHDKGIAVILDGVFGHNGGSVAPSPNRNGIRNPGITPDTNNPVNYATNGNSLKYYSDVARYWITEHKIDGWRFDQCYQLGHGEYNSGKNCNTGGHNYWYEIRNVIEEAAASNGTKGTDWGTLGYMVGEDWDGNAQTIQASVVDSWSSAGYGLNSCFDFPAYYQVIQGFAQEWDGKTTGNITTGLSYLYKTYTEKGYVCKDSDGSYDIYYPNFMLTNHDLYRIGDLIQKKWSCGYESSEYVGRNKVLLAAQCAYSGPITIYYGDEIGARSADNSNGSGWYPDNVARSSGKITNFTSNERTVHDWTQKCLSARADHQALWSGSNQQIVGESDFYVAKKVGGGETIYIAFNYSKSQKTFSASGTDLISGTSYNGTVTVPALSAVYVLSK